MSEFIKLRNIVKVYGSGENAFLALKGIDLDINAGEFVALMGPSGSGKSTMANILGCLDKATKGTYMFNGVDVFALNRNETALLRRNYIGFIFQGFNLGIHIGTCFLYSLYKSPKLFSSCFSSNKTK